MLSIDLLEPLTCYRTRFHELLGCGCDGVLWRTWFGELDAVSFPKRTHKIEEEPRKQHRERNWIVKQHSLLNSTRNQHPKRPQTLSTLKASNPARSVRH